MDLIEYSRNLNAQFDELDRKMSEPISSVEAKILKEQAEAIRLLGLLETAMVRCGYSREGIYNSRMQRFSGPREPSTVLFWKGGKILLSVAKKDDPRDGSLVAGIRGMTPGQLLRVAHHLSPFLDKLEEGSRHLLKELTEAAQKIRNLIEDVEAGQTAD